MQNYYFESKAAELLTKHGYSIAIAESCTGGLLGHQLTNIPGSSAFFLGGIIAYANQVKIKLLGVSRETLEQFGAVSRETVSEMAYGARLMLGADIGLATTGIAGPDGGTVEKPVGYVWIGISTPDDELTWQFTWSGNRIENKILTAHKAIELLVEYLLKL